MSEEPSSMSLSELRKSLESAGFPMALNTLSELLSTGDVSEVLGIERKGNRLSIPPGVVNILTEFLPQYKEARGERPQLSGMLRGFLKQRIEGGGIVPVSSSEFRGKQELVKYGDGAMELLSEIRDILKSEKPDDWLLTKEQAAEILKCKPMAVPQLVPAALYIAGRARWRHSDVQKFIQYPATFKNLPIESL